MTLKEFVKNFMEVNGIEWNVDSMLARITSEARKKAKGEGCVVLSEEDVEQIILNAGKEKEKPAEKPVVKPVTKPEKKAEPKKEEKKDIQMAFDLWGTL